VKPIYLEIGVSRGSHSGGLWPTRRSPSTRPFKLSARSRRLADAGARATHYFETTSDAFFANETTSFYENRLRPHELKVGRGNSPDRVPVRPAGFRRRLCAVGYRARAPRHLLDIFSTLPPHRRTIAADPAVRWSGRELQIFGR
jgi:hypothetical protein